MIAAVLLAGCGGDDTETVDGPIEGYRADLKTGFVEDCTSAGTARSTCVCWYESLEAHVAFERFEQLDAAIRNGTGEVPAEIQDLAVACAAQSDE